MSANVIHIDPTARDAEEWWSDGACNVVEARRLMAGIGLTKFYELAAAGAVKVKKDGRRTIVSRASIAHYMASLPDANLKGAS